MSYNRAWTFFSQLRCVIYNSFCDGLLFLPLFSFLFFCFFFLSDFKFLFIFGPNIETVQPIPYLPEDLNHFQEFTHFLDSIGLPGEWLPSEGETSQTQEENSEDVRDTGRSTHEQHERPRRSGEGSRGDSPFRSWLPSVPRGDQSLGALSDSGT